MGSTSPIPVASGLSRLPPRDAQLELRDERHPKLWACRRSGRPDRWARDERTAGPASRIGSQCDARGVPLIARCTATLVGDELVLTMLNGTEHSRIPVDDDMDAAEALERLSNGTMPVRLLWSVDRTSERPLGRAN